MTPPINRPLLVAIDADATWLATLIQAFTPRYTVVPCQTLVAGFAAIQVHHPSVVTIDLGSFGGTEEGIHLLPALRELPNYPHLTVCGISASTATRQLSLHHKLAAFEEGVDAYYVKGLPLIQLFCSIHLLNHMVQRFGHERYTDVA